MDLSLLPDGGMRWLDASGAKSTIVLSTRIRLARNVRGVPFSQRAKDADRTTVLDRVSEAAAATEHLSAAVAFHLDEMERPERQLLHERHAVRCLEMRQPVSAQLDQLRLGRRRPLLQHHVRMRSLSPLLVGQPHDRCLLHRRMAQQHTLDLDR